MTDAHRVEAVRRVPADRSALVAHRRGRTARGSGPLDVPAEELGCDVAGTSHLQLEGGAIRRRAAEEPDVLPLAEGLGIGVLVKLSSVPTPSNRTPPLLPTRTVPAPRSALPAVVGMSASPSSRRFRAVPVPEISTNVRGRQSVTLTSVPSRRSVSKSWKTPSAVVKPRREAARRHEPDRARRGRGEVGGAGLVEDAAFDDLSCGGSDGEKRSKGA